MNVTFFIDSLEGGGAERVVCNLSNYLIKKNNNVRIIIFSEGEVVYKLNPKAEIIPLIRKNEKISGKIEKYIIRFNRLKSIIKAAPERCYIAFTETPIILLLLARRYVKGPIIISERTNPDSYLRVIQFALKCLVRRTDGIVYQTEDVKKWYKSYIDKNVLEYVIPNAINEEFYREIYTGIKRDRIVAVGRLTEQKNYPLMIKAFKKVSDKYPQYTLSIYGKGPLENSLKNLVSELELRDKVFFKGFVYDIAEQIEDAKLFLMSSDYEGMPNALMEAMAMGIACISTDCPIGGPRYLIDSAINGILVPIGDVDGFAKAIEDLILDEKLTNQIGNNAKNIRDNLSPSKVYSKWENVIIEMNQISKSKHCKK